MTKEKRLNKVRERSFVTNVTIVISSATFVKEQTFDFELFTSEKQVQKLK